MADNIGVIGGSGFIGSRLVELLLAANDKPVKIFDKAPSNRFNHLVEACDVRSFESLQKVIEPGSVLVNLAAEHRDDVTPKSLYDEVNVTGAKNICAVAIEKNVEKIIFLSSVAIYGFAPIGTDESGNVAPFNDYGRTKFEAEQILKAWQAESPNTRMLMIIRPTVVFGEKNRGNVYNLLRQIASGKFLMIGSGENRKSMAYVENVAAFIQHGLQFKPGLHIYNYIDKPDFTMNALVQNINQILGKKAKLDLKLPYFVGALAGRCFDAVAFITGKKFAISAIRVKKFCSNSVYETSLARSGFIPPISMTTALENTVKYEFLDTHDRSDVFFSE